jgi:hypothetical protein
MNIIDHRLDGLSLGGLFFLGHRVHRSPTTASGRTRLPAYRMARWPTEAPAPTEAGLRLPPGTSGGYSSTMAVGATEAVGSTEGGKGLMVVVRAG